MHFAPGDLGMSVVTMGRGKRLRMPLEVQITGDGKDEVATFGLPEGRPQLDAPDWRAFVARFNGNPPSIFLHGNGRGRSYLAMVLPRDLGERKGRVVHLTHEILGADAVDGKHVHYRDGNPFNLRRSNLQLIDRKVAAAMATGEADAA
jgi:hypothetical protein